MKFLFATLLLMGAHLLAAQSAKAPTGIYFHNHKVEMLGEEEGGNQEATDELQIFERPEGGYDVDVELVFTNGHTCGLSGEGEWKSNVLSVREGTSCVLNIRFDVAKIVLGDNRTCKSYCGVRGDFAGAEFLRKNKRPGSENINRDLLAKKTAQGELVEAAKWLETPPGLRLPEHDALREKIVKSAHAKALALWKSNKRKAGLELLDGVMRVLNADDPEIKSDYWTSALNDLGYFELEDGNPTGATYLFERVLLLNPKRAVSYLNLGDSLLNQTGQKRRAQWAFQQYAKAVPKVKWPKNFTKKCDTCEALLAPANEAETQKWEKLLQGKWKLKGDHCGNSAPTAEAALSAEKLAKGTWLANLEFLPGRKLLSYHQVTDVPCSENREYRHWRATKTNQLSVQVIENNFFEKTDRGCEPRKKTPADAEFAARLYRLEMDGNTLKISYDIASSADWCEGDTPLQSEWVRF